MRPHLMFIHTGYPAQFGPAILFLLKHYEVDISFFCQFVEQHALPKIQQEPLHQKVSIYSYKPDPYENQAPYFYSQRFERECQTMVGLYQAVLDAKLSTPPDVVIGHAAYGTLSWVPVEYPEATTIGYFEGFYSMFDETKFSRPPFPVPKRYKLARPLTNATQLVTLETVTQGYSPSAYQRSSYPVGYQDKISVLFDGVDTQHYAPGPLKENHELKRTWPAEAKIITFVSRGLEYFRGFDIFMEIVHQLSQKRSDVHFVIAGSPKTHYGYEMLHLQGKAASFKDYVLQQKNYDLSRFHFLEWISEDALADLYRMSACHVYWTIPLNVSWSLVQAMATGALVLGSKVAPVEEFIQHGINGLLFDPYDIDGAVTQLLEVLDSPQRFTPIREAARDTVVSQYSYEVCLPALADFYCQSTRVSPPALASVP